MMKKKLIVLPAILAIISVCSILTAAEEAPIKPTTPTEPIAQAPVKDKPTLKELGTITGFVKGGIPRHQKDAVVYIEKMEREFPAPKYHGVMDQISLTFVPHVLPIMKGTTVDFPNSDYILDIEHNVFSPDDIADKMDLGDWPVGELRNHTFNKLGVAVMLCHLHPDMEAFVVVLQNPFFDKTHEDGKFAIEGILPGEYTLNVWHKRLGADPQKVVVAPGETTTVDFVFNKRKKDYH